MTSRSGRARSAPHFEQRGSLPCACPRPGSTRFSTASARWRRAWRPPPTGAEIVRLAKEHAELQARWPRPPTAWPRARAERAGAGGDGRRRRRRDGRLWRARSWPRWTRACRTLERDAGPAAGPARRRRERLGHPGGARRHRRRRGGAVRRRPVPHVPALRRRATAGRWRWRAPREGEPGGYKEIIASIAGEGVFGAAEVRERRPPGAARARHRDARPHPHLRRHRRGAARGRGRRHRDQRRRHPHRHLPLVRRRRPARQQDRLGGAHHPPADRHRRHLVGESPAPEPRPGDEGAEGHAATSRSARRWTPSAPRRARARWGPATARSASAPTTSRKAG